MPLAAYAPIPYANCPDCLGGGTSTGGMTVAALNDLTDVMAGAPLPGQTIVWDPTANGGAGGYVLGFPTPGPHPINDHSDVDTATNPPTDGQVLTWNTAEGEWEPAASAATCALHEIGGNAGPLGIGNGAGVANPVQTGYTLTADRIVATVTTAPAGGADVFEVRLEPAGTVITTGTVADGTMQATFTPFLDVILTDGEWIETVVTAVAPTPLSLIHI